MEGTPVSFIDELKGCKTFIIAGATIVYALVSHYFAGMDSTQTVNLILQGLGLAGLRAGINNAKPLE